MLYSVTLTIRHCHGDLMSSDSTSKGKDFERMISLRRSVNKTCKDRKANERLNQWSHQLVATMQPRLKIILCTYVYSVNQWHAQYNLHVNIVCMHVHLNTLINQNCCHVWREGLGCPSQINWCSSTYEPHDQKRTKLPWLSKLKIYKSYMYLLHVAAFQLILTTCTNSTFTLFSVLAWFYV